MHSEAAPLDPRNESQLISLLPLLLYSNIAVAAVAGFIVPIIIFSLQSSSHFKSDGDLVTELGLAQLLRGRRREV